MEVEMRANSLQELYVEQLRDLYNAENQIIKALPEMVESAQSDELRNALNEHLEVTRNQATRLEQIFEKLGEKPGSEKCKGMEGVLKEGSDLLDEVSEQIMDAAIIASAQRVEHYEMAGYGTARTYAELLGEDEAAAVLDEILGEEKEADQTLTGLAEELNAEALEAGEASEEVNIPEKSAGAKKTGSRNKRAA